MVKHAETIRQLLPTNCLSVFDHFVELVFKGLSEISVTFYLMHGSLWDFSISLVRTISQLKQILNTKSYAHDWEKGTH